MDITPLIPEGINIINGYGNGSFVINKQEHKGSVMLKSDWLKDWTAQSFAEVNFDSLQEIIKVKDSIELLIIGCGEKQLFLNPELKRLLNKENIVAEVMVTGAACRTYNVLITEGRAVAAALIAV